MTEDIKRHQLDWKILIIATFLYAFGFSIYGGVFTNFAKDIVNATPLQYGGLESIREIPGLCAALMAGILVALAEARVAALGLAIMAIGIGLTGHFTDYWPLVGITVLWSIGFHTWSSVAPAITLNLSKGANSGKNLGKMNAVYAFANLIALGCALILAKIASLFSWPQFTRYNVYYYIAGASILAGAVLCMTLSHHSSGQKRQPIIVRREYGLFYLLTFLEGCRRQILGTFVFFTLVSAYGLPLRTMLVLQFVSLVLSVAVSPAVGKLIDRIGERKPLTVYAGLLILVFAGYALIPNVYILCGLFIVDRVIQAFSVGYSTYLQKIVRPGELTPSVAMGVTMNHIAAVIIPVTGAWLWQHYKDYTIPFWIGVGVAVIALFSNQRLPDHPTKNDPEPTPA
ncbi:MAG: MFS transporter [Fimbriimonadaceae bacterium]|nr:MFS transporter [Fimbriimonadaceae bacterium]